jgi:hypothetical protein
VLRARAFVLRRRAGLCGRARLRGRAELRLRAELLLCPEVLQEALRLFPSLLPQEELLRSDLLCSGTELWL